MSSHLRHCPKHRKPLPCAHCALVAKSVQSSVAVAVLDPEPAAVIEIVPSNRGRKPEHGVAMTGAERKARSRANQKEKQDDVERRNIIAKLMNIFQRQESHSRTTKAAQDRRNHQRIYLTGLKTLSLTELQTALDAKQTPDTHGRLH